MAAKKLKPARKSARPANSGKKARAKKAEKATKKRAPPQSVAVRPAEPETPQDPPVLPTPSATFVF